MNDISGRYKAVLKELVNNYPAFQNIGAQAYRPGLASTLELSRRMGDPHMHLRTIHIAGTNGKGTTATTLAAVLETAGYRVGLYTSPHLVDFRERIRINGVMIPEECVIDFIDRFHLQREPGDATPSFFELTTVMALDYFHRRKVDVAVIEVGLGGRLDSTNIICPDLCVITNISLDHTQILGATLTKIATEKAGIIKAGVPVVVGEAGNEVRSVFEQRASELGAPIFFAQDYADRTRMQCGPCGKISVVESPFGTFETELKGSFQCANTATCLCALSQLREAGYHFGDDAVACGFKHVADMLHGRWEEHDGVLCDSGHNAAAWEYTARYFANHAENLIAILGFCADKDVKTIIGMLPPKVKYYCVAAPTQRAIPATELERMMLSRGLDARSFGCVKDAVNAAKAEKTAEIFLGGSFYVVAEYLK